MEKKSKSHYKLPGSMRNKTLDLRSSSTQSPVDSKPPGSEQKVAKIAIPAYSHNTKKQTKPNKTTPKNSNKWKTIGLIILAAVCLAAAIYLIFLLLAPKLLSSNKTNFFGGKDAKQDNSNRITIASVGINAQIIEGDVGALEKGAWHRLPNQGDPTKGGNFIVTGHSFVWGYTPQQIKEKSVFYALPDVKKDDKVMVKWGGKDYAYKVSEVKKVLPNQTEVESQTKDPQLTIYTCTLSGSSDGRVVVIAKPA